MLTLNAKDLISRTIRTNLSNGKFGSALLKTTLDTAKPRIIGKSQQDAEGNLLVRAGNFLGKVAKGLFSGVLSFLGWAGMGLVKLAAGLIWDGIKLTFSAAWGIIVSTAQTLWQFDWNASDEALQAGIKNQNVALAGIWGGVAGQAFGWIAGIGIGYGISLVVPVIGGALLARTIAAKVGTEALEELSSSFAAALKATVRTYTKSVIVSAYIGLRQMIKRTDQKTLEKLVGKEGANAIKNQWGNKGGPSFSFAEYVDKKVESIKGKELQAFIENFLEESWDSFVEAGFIVAQELDDAYAQQRLQNKNQLGTERTVTVQPDRRLDEEILTFSNVPQNLLMPAVQQAINTHRLVANRDIGQFVGERVEDYARTMPLALRAQIKLFSVKEPPYVSTSKRRVTEVTVSIPDLSRSKIDWFRIKEACGGTNGYMWGRFKATAQLSNGRPFVVYGATAMEAEDRLKAYLTLTTAELVTLTITEEKKEGARLKNPRLQKDATRVYPAYFVIINRDLQTAIDLGKPTKRGNYRDRSGRIELWPSTKPSDFEDVVRDLLKKATL